MLEGEHDLLRLRGVVGKGGWGGGIGTTTPGGEINILNKNNYFSLLKNVQNCERIKMRLTTSNDDFNPYTANVGNMVSC